MPHRKACRAFQVSRETVERIDSMQRAGAFVMPVKIVGKGGATAIVQCRTREDAAELMRRSLEEYWC